VQDQNIFTPLLWQRQLTAVSDTTDVFDNRAMPKWPLSAVTWYFAIFLSLLNAFEKKSVYIVKLLPIILLNVTKQETKLYASAQYRLIKIESLQLFLK
jgi:hypothetical protein